MYLKIEKVVEFEGVDWGLLFNSVDFTLAIALTEAFESIWAFFAGPFAKFEFQGHIKQFLLSFQDYSGGPSEIQTIGLVVSHQTLFDMWGCSSQKRELWLLHSEKLMWACLFPWKSVWELLELLRKDAIPFPLWFPRNSSLAVPELWSWSPVGLPSWTPKLESRRLARYVSYLHAFKSLSLLSSLVHKIPKKSF